MFSTFDAMTPDSSVSQKKDAPTQARPKRAQVSRACDWCRLTRVKCDKVRPCRNCKQAGRECLDGGRDDFKSVAAATREVQRLRRKVEELEAKLLSPSSMSCSKDVHEASAPVRWRGCFVDNLHYGPSSLTYFVQRLAKFTSLDLEVDAPENEQRNWMPSLPEDACQLNRFQQDNFLAQFWQSYHAIYPILDEEEFRRHYDSLWLDSNTRKSCPLVDVVLALCIRSTTSFVSQHPEINQDTKQQNHDFYMRAQRCLLQYHGSPTLARAQSCVLSVTYLLTLGNYKAAYMMIGTAFKMAHSLGISQYSAGQGTPEKDERLRMVKTRLWACLSTLDIRISLHLGRPLTIHNKSFSIALISQLDDRVQLETIDSSAIQPKTDRTAETNWFKFQIESYRLFQIAYEIQTELAVVCETVLAEIDSEDFYSHPVSREKCAAFLRQKVKKLDDWVRELPDYLKTPRVQGVPFSIDRSSLNLGYDTPLWLQHQRLVLELDYHALCITLTRTFVTFLPAPTLGTLSSDNNCISCTNHAIAMTNILHQVLKDTEILTEWYQVADWQRTAMFAAAGFACGYPICPPTPSSRKAVITAAKVFDMIGTSELAGLSRRLDEKTIEIIKNFTAKLGITTPAFTPALPTSNQSIVSGSQIESTLNPISAITDLDLINFTDAVNLDGGEAGLWGTGEASLLWADLMRDMNMSLTPSLGDDDTPELTDQ